MSEMTFEEFCNVPLTYVLGMSGDWGARRMHRNEELGIQRETYTKRARHGDIYGGWKESTVAYFLDGDDRQFANVAELYMAWMHHVCGVKEQEHE